MSRSRREARVSPVRQWFVLVLLMSGLAVLGARAAQLQIVETEYLQSQGDARYLREVRVSATRGRILDRHGQPLAVSTPVDSVWAHPGELSTARDRWPELASRLKIPEQEIAEAVERNRDREFMYLKRHLPPEQAGEIVDLGIPGVAKIREYRRYYPAGPVAAHLVGFTNIDDVGQEGLELLHDQRLAGRDGIKRVMRDRLGNIVEDVESVRQVIDGRDLQVSIDSRIQFLAYRHLRHAVSTHRASGGSAVVLDVTTGEVLAMVNEPGFNPNKRRRGNRAAFRNRAVTDVVEPGSTMKPFTIAMALATGTHGPDSRVDTAPGYLRVGRNTIRDHRNYGTLNVTRVLVKSSNVGAAKIAMAQPAENLVETMASVGLGRSTGIGLPGEVDGTLPRDRKWRPIEHATLAFGYGLSVTPLQLARAYTVLARDGSLIPLTLRPRSTPVEGRQVMKAAVAREVRRMLIEATSREGTGSAARLEQYTVAGKTGTVHKVTENGYAEHRYTSLFVGMAPASRPRLVMVVVVDDPRGDAHFGGEVAAPVFSAVMSGALRLLNVAPDKVDAGERDGEAKVVRVGTGEGA